MSKKDRRLDMMTFRNEAELKAFCFDYAKTQGVLPWNIRGLSVKGIPDSVFVFEGGGVVWVEFKHPNGLGVLSESQKERIKELRTQNAAVYECDALLYFVQIIAIHKGKIPHAR